MLEAGLIVSRFLHYAATLFLAGVTLFPFYASSAQAVLHRLQRVTLWLTLLALVSGAGWFLFTAGTMADDPAGMTDPSILSAVLFSTAFGQLWIARLCIALVILVLLCWTPMTMRRWFVPLFACALLVSLAGTGHARNCGGALHMIADGIHLLAAGLWLGGLIPLGMNVASTLRNPDIDIVKVLTRFSGVASIAVALLVLSGIVNGWFLLDPLSAIVDTPYGRLLLLKLGVFLIMLFLALVNRFHITPSLQRSADSSPALLARLQHHILAEQLLGLLVLGLVSLLGLLSLNNL